jgi:hypothetical protein
MKCVEEVDQLVVLFVDALDSDFQTIRPDNERHGLVIGRCCGPFDSNLSPHP